jgi:glycosyltransferase involved in cell wall biosynthesis
VVHLNDYAHAALPFRAPVLVVGHSCVASWFEAVKGAPAPPAFDRYRREVAKGLAAADLVVAPTRWMLEALRRHYGALPRARVIANGRAVPAFRSLERKEPFVLSAGRLWDEAKNAAALDAAADGLPWPVLLAGDARPPGGRAGSGWSGPRHARALGLLPPEELAGFHQRASIYAAPARYEPFGLSILGRRWPAARSCWATSRACARPGTAPRCSPTRSPEPRSAPC